jgi:hypothetical protein
MKVQRVQLYADIIFLYIFVVEMGVRALDGLAAPDTLSIK